MASNHNVLHLSFASLLTLGLAIIIAIWNPSYFNFSQWNIFTKINKSASLLDIETYKNLPELDLSSIDTYLHINSPLDPWHWGTYRSGLYYGLRSRTYPYFISAGLLWTSQHEDISQLRHECDQRHKMQQYGWKKHDGYTFGIQNIQDQLNRMEISTSYLRLTHDLMKTKVLPEDINGWVSHIDVAHIEPQDKRYESNEMEETSFSLYFYVDLGCENEDLEHPCRQQLIDYFTINQQVAKEEDCTSSANISCTSLTLESDGGEFKELFNFHVHVQLRTKDSSIESSELRYKGMKSTSHVNIRQKLIRLSERKHDQDSIDFDNTIEDGASIVIFQATAKVGNPKEIIKKGDFTLDVIYHEGSSQPSKEMKQVYKTAYNWIPEEIHYRSQAFDEKFQLSFPIFKEKISSGELTPSHFALGQSALSDLIGGVSYFYGSSIIRDNYASDENEPVIYESSIRPLLTTVPSRSFFPRGFIWDEGFHHLGIVHFAPKLSQQILAHWFGVMDTKSGYIPRELIFGKSSEARVPSEFLVQQNLQANPPTFTLVLEVLLASSSVDKTYLDMIYPFLKRWYDWFLVTQSGSSIRGSFQWKGRKQTPTKLHPNTMASGLDDYPRASQPSKEEMHVDLLCWMIRLNRNLYVISKRLNKPADVIAALQMHFQQFKQVLHDTHWSSKHRLFFDVGYDSHDGVIVHKPLIRCRNMKTMEHIDVPANSIEDLKRGRRAVGLACPSSHPRYYYPLDNGNGELLMQPVFVPKTTKFGHVLHIGYLSFFPLFLKVLNIEVKIEAKQLLALLTHLKNPKHLWTSNGLRSLSTEDIFYQVGNAEGDKPYWRGPIWMNVNYLALDALYYYSHVKTESDNELIQSIQSQAKVLYIELRQNVMQTIYNEYTTTGFLWEQYNGYNNLGKGQGVFPFTGWTALVVNIMAENYGPLESLS